MIALAILLGCSGGSDGGGSPSPFTGHTGAPPACETRVAVGTGVLAFEPLKEGDDVDVVHGPQGGYHVTVAARLCGLAPAPAEVHTVITRRSDDLVVSDVRYTKPEVPEDDCCRTATDMWAYLFIDGVDAGPALDNQAVSIALEVLDSDGTMHRDAVEVVLHNP